MHCTSLTQKIFFYEANCGCSSQLRCFSPIGQLAQTIGFQSTGIDWCLVRPRDLKGKRVLTKGRLGAECVYLVEALLASISRLQGCLWFGCTYIFMFAMHMITGCHELLGICL